MGAPAAGPTGDPALWVGVLGPLQLTVAGVKVDVPGAKRRAVLAMLAMAAPDPISVDRLVDAVWPNEPPASGRAALQTHVSRVRRHLGPSASALSSTGSGYRLDLAAGLLDATLALTWIREARAATDDPVGARERLAAARSLWRGPPLADLQHVPPLTAWSRLLTEAWLEASDLLVRAALDTGEGAMAVTVATETLAAEPLREAGALQLVRALAVHGRAPQALRVAHDFRRRLREETGLDPSPALAQLERWVSSSDAGPAAAEPPSGLRPLPRWTGQLVGRAHDLEALVALLDAGRLVTVVGPGGVGKTRLATAVAQQLAEAGRPVTMLPLAQLTDGEAIADALAGALGVQADVGDLMARCALRLRAGRLLLVIDNGEHLLAAVRRLVELLLGTCPGLTILATSRERLGLPLEQPYVLAPLAVPDDEPTAALAAVPSVALFLDRARRIRPELEPDATELAAIARLVRSLDGLPLAIELAAGRLSSLTIDAVVDRLDRALDLLVGAPQDATGGPDTRHRTLRSAIAWSYELLPADEQRLFRNLAVFPGGFALETAELVAAALGIRGDPAAALGHLVDSSMVVADLDPPPRYHLLDTLRRFGLDRLDASGERSIATDRLVAWAVDLGRWLDAAVTTDDELRADKRLRAELGNLRAAWHVARAGGDLDAAAALVVALCGPVAWRDMTEVWRWALELATDPDLAGHPREAAVLAVASEAAWFSSGDLDRAEALARRSLATAAPDDGLGGSLARLALADVLLFRGRYDEARALALESTAAVGALADGWFQAALAAAYDGDLDEARALLDQAGTATRSPTLQGYRRYIEGELANLDGDWATATAAYDAAIVAGATTGASFLEGIAAVGLVSAQVAHGYLRDALVGYRDLIDRWERTGGWTQQWTTLRNLATLLDRLGDPATAARLQAAADAAPEAASAALGEPDGRPRPVGPDRDEILGIARAAIARALTSPVPE